MAERRERRGIGSSIGEASTVASREKVREGESGYERGENKGSLDHRCTKHTHTLQFLLKKDNLKLHDKIVV